MMEDDDCISSCDHGSDIFKTDPRKGQGISGARSHGCAVHCINSLMFPKKAIKWVRETVEQDITAHLLTPTDVTYTHRCWQTGWLYLPVSLLIDDTKSPVFWLNSTPETVTPFHSFSTSQSAFIQKFVEKKKGNPAKAEGEVVASGDNECKFGGNNKLNARLLCHEEGEIGNSSVILEQYWIITPRHLLPDEEVNYGGLFDDSSSESDTSCCHSFVVYCPFSVKQQSEKGKEKKEEGCDPAPYFNPVGVGYAIEVQYNPKKKKNTPQNKSISFTLNKKRYVQKETFPKQQQEEGEEKGNTSSFVEVVEFGDYSSLFCLRTKVDNMDWRQAKIEVDYGDCADEIGWIKIRVFTQRFLKEMILSSCGSGGAAVQKNGNEEEDGADFLTVVKTLPGCQLPWPNCPRYYQVDKADHNGYMDAFIGHNYLLSPHRQQQKNNKQNSVVDNVCFGKEEYNQKILPRMDSFVDGWTLSTQIYLGDGTSRTFSVAIIMLTVQQANDIVGVVCEAERDEKNSVSFFFSGLPEFFSETCTNSHQRFVSEDQRKQIFKKTKKEGVDYRAIWDVPPFMGTRIWENMTTRQRSKSGGEKQKGSGDAFDDTDGKEDEESQKKNQMVQFLNSVKENGDRLIPLEIKVRWKDNDGKGRSLGSMNLHFTFIRRDALLRQSRNLLFSFRMMKKCCLNDQFDESKLPPPSPYLSHAWGADLESARSLLRLVVTILPEEVILYMLSFLYVTPDALLVAPTENVPPVSVVDVVQRYFYPSLSQNELLPFYPQDIRGNKDPKIAADVLVESNGLSAAMLTILRQTQWGIGDICSESSESSDDTDWDTDDGMGLFD